MLAERPAMQMQRHQGPSLRPSTSPVLSCNGWIMASGLSSSHLEQQRRQRALCRCQSTVRPGPGPGRPASQLDDPTLNKVPIALTMQPHLYTYLLDHTREHPALAALRAETSEVAGAHMQITPEQGALLALLAELVNTKRAIEVGVFTGYSALAVALTLPEDGVLMALDRDVKTMEIAHKYFALGGVSHKIHTMIGPATDSLRQLLDQYGPNSFDFAFIDADKRAYDSYYETVLQLVRPGGLIAVDNVLFYGKVAEPEVQDKATQALRDFNTKVMSDPRVSLSIIPVGDGLALCRKRG